MVPSRFPRPRFRSTLPNSPSPRPILPIVNKPIAPPECGELYLRILWNAPARPDACFPCFLPVDLVRSGPVALLSVASFRLHLLRAAQGAGIPVHPPCGRAHQLGMQPLRKHTCFHLQYQAVPAVLSSDGGATRRTAASARGLASLCRSRHRLEVSVQRSLYVLLAALRDSRQVMRMQVVRIAIPHCDRSGCPAVCPRSRHPASTRPAAASLAAHEQMPSFLLTLSGRSPRLAGLFDSWVLLLRHCPTQPPHCSIHSHPGLLSRGAPP